MFKLSTFFRSNVADELHFAAPDIKGVQDTVRVSGGGMSEDVLKGTLLSAQTSNAVLPYPDEDCPIEQHKEVTVPDNQRQQEWKEGQSNSRRHHPSIYRQKHTCTGRLFVRYILTKWALYYLLQEV